MRNLEEWTQYRLTLSARNIVGEGEVTEVIFTTNETGMHHVIGDFRKERQFLINDINVMPIDGTQ